MEPPSDATGPSGRDVVFWLFIALAIMTAISLVWFAQLVKPEFRPRVYASLVVNLALPLIAWYTFRHMKRNRAA